MYRLWGALHSRTMPPTQEEIRIANGTTTLDARTATEFIQKLERASSNIETAFACQAAEAAVSFVSFLLHVSNIVVCPGTMGSG